ncbi:hypothetical protein [Parendozoicomonas sp. Alg238-R29]|uniref:hypothetical protein n=1 Tax=Parendozoicomonas sp. Alg238-R29 TaxID=2993446 RepID=UPI00248DCFFE|nr:hypothetical protein [Parendozoicomonas sp. Alg238-R29]
MRSLIVTASFLLPVTWAAEEVDSTAGTGDSLDPIAKKAIAYAVPATAYSHSPMGKIDEGSKALAKKLYIEYSHQVLSEQFEGSNPDQLLWTNYLKVVYHPIKAFIFADIDSRMGISNSHSSSPDQDKQISEPGRAKERMEKKLKEWSKKAFYYYFNPPEASAESFDALKQSITARCEEALGKLATNEPDSQLSDYYYQCYQPVSDLAGSKLTSLVPVDRLAALLLFNSRLAVNPEGIPPRLAQSLTWYAVLSNEALTHFESAIEDKSGFKDEMMDMFKRGYSPETMAKVFRQNFVNFGLAYRKIWYYYEKHKANEWYSKKRVRTF